MDAGKLKYVDIRPIFIPPGQLKHHPGGVSLPSKDNIIDVTAGEKKNLLKLKNGTKPSFEEVKAASKISEDK